MKRKLYITILGLLSTIMTAAVPYCDVRKFSITDGLAANTISDLKQGKDNLMWFSTWNGLSFYDGYSFHTFRDNPDDIDILSTNRILKIEPSYNNNVWCITYDHQLYIYDTHFCQFFPVGKKFNELFNIDLRVKQVYPLKNGATWFTSEDGKYIIRSTGRTFDEQNIDLIKVGDKGLKSKNVWYIHLDTHGREWVLTDKGACIYHSKFPSKLPFKWIRWVGDDVFLATEDGKLAKYDLQNRLTMIPMPEGVTRINELKNTGYQLLMATNLGVVIYNPRTFKFDIINVQSPSQPLPEVKKIYTDDFGMVWAFTDGMGVTLVNPKTGQTQWLFADQEDPMDRTSCESNFITQDENKTLWVVPRGGTFSYFDRKAGKLVPYLLRSNSSGNYRIPKITKYVLSDQGILWLTGTHDLTQVVFKYHPYVINKLDVGEDEVFSVNASPDGHIWAGYHNGVIQVLNASYQSIGYLSPSGQIVPQQVNFADKGIFSIYFDIKGRAWIGTNGNGIYLLDKMQVRHFAYDPNNPSSLPFDKVFDIVADRTGRIWIGTYGGGLALVNEAADGSISFISKRNGLPWEKQNYDRIRRICCTTTGTILVGTTDGLITFSDAFTNARKINYHKTYYIPNDTTSLAANDVNNIMEHTSGKMYISQQGGVMEEIVNKSLLQDNLKMKYFNAININEGIVQGMIEDNQGRIWVIRESSIDCVDPKTGKCNVFGPNDFDFNMSFSNSRPYHDPASNNISVGTPMGLITFNPATLKKSNYQPKVVFSSLHYSGEKESEPILHKEKVVIPANKRNLTITFASLDYERKYQTQYLYRIDGYTAPGEWISNGSSNVIGFNRISHGDYVLKVRATNSHGVWSKYVAELPIEVRPTFWESIWGKFLMLLLLIGIVGAIFYTYNQRQRENVSHEMSMLKNEFYNDAANRLRTPLTLIGAPVKTVLETEPGITRKGKELLKMVVDNAHEMLMMLDKVQRYGNNADFHTNSGLTEEDYDLTERENANGQIDDHNVADYLQEVNKAKEEKDEEAERLEEMGKEKEDAQEETERKDQTVLVVEDNADLRKFLYSILSPTYNVLLAENGKAGLVMTRKEIPDFILTDVGMPVMDGLSMIHEIKQDTTLNNIPVMILSAKASVEDQQRGFDEGVDAYITKPFSTSYLLGRIEAILTQRRNIRVDVIRKLKDAGDKDAIAALRILPATAPLPVLNQTEQGAEKETVDPKSELAFMAAQIQDRTMMRVFRFVVENAGNPELKIEDISNEIGMSRSVLYNKVKATTGMTPVDFVRHIRIKKACEMLRTTDDTLTSIAFAVGFTDPKYFSKVFKKETGIVPTEYRNRTQV